MTRTRTRSAVAAAALALTLTGCAGSYSGPERTAAEDRELASVPESVREAAADADTTTTDLSPAQRAMAESGCVPLATTEDGEPVETFAGQIGCTADSPVAFVILDADQFGSADLTVRQAVASCQAATDASAAALADCAERYGQADV